MDREYLLLFIVGGLLTIATKHITNHISPKIGAILATLPIALFSAFFIINDDKIRSFLRGYSKQSLINILITIIYILLLENTKYNHKFIYIISLSLWVLFAFLQIFL